MIFSSGMETCVDKIDVYRVVKRNLKNKKQISKTELRETILLEGRQLLERRLATGVWDVKIPKHRM